MVALSRDPAVVTRRNSGAYSSTTPDRSHQPRAAGLSADVGSNSPSAPPVARARALRAAGTDAVADLRNALHPSLYPEAARHFRDAAGDESLGAIVLAWLVIEVGLMLPLARAVTDHEWEQLVAELRATFRAKGRITTHGNLREWSNGNLSAAIEPTETGYRLRLGTLKGDAIGINAMAATGMAGSAVGSSTVQSA